MKLWSNLVAIALVTSAVVFSAAPASEAADTSPGKIAAYASTTSAQIKDFDTILSASLKRGKRHRVVEVDFSVTVPTAPSNGSLSGVAVVNGLTILEPSKLETTITAVETCSTPLIPCLLNGHFWLDLDAAEAAHPGVFMGKPIVVEVQAQFVVNPTFIPTVSGDASIRLRMTRK